MYDIYIRVSRLGDRSEDEATEVYEEQCREWAASNNLIVDEVEEDTRFCRDAANVVHSQVGGLTSRACPGSAEGAAHLYAGRRLRGPRL